LQLYRRVCDAYGSGMRDHEQTCMNCGNEIGAGTVYCPFCDAPQMASVVTPRRRGGVRTVNLKEGLPTLEEALRRLDGGLDAAKRDGVALLRVIHGYGSSGTGGIIRQGVRSRFIRLQREGVVRNVVPGDDYCRTDGPGRDLVRRHPALQKSVRTDTRNRGITFLEL